MAALTDVDEADDGLGARAAQGVPELAHPAVAGAVEDSLLHRHLVVRLKPDVPDQTGDQSEEGGGDNDVHRVGLGFRGIR